MAQILKCGDTVNLLNGYAEWNGGYLDSYGLAQAGARFGVVTADTPNRHPETGKWVIESGSGKVAGAEVISGDSILLKNLFENGTYLFVHEDAPAPSKFKVKTVLPHAPGTPADELASTIKWRIFAETSSPSDGKVREGDVVKLLNGYVWDNTTDNGGFMEVNGPAGVQGLKYHVSTTYYTNKADANTALWKLLIAR